MQCVPHGRTCTPCRSRENQVAYSLAVLQCSCCSQDAVGFQTTVTAQMAQEQFSVSGLMVTQRNWLEVYPYTSWGGSTVPTLQPGQVFEPRELLLRAGQTEPPPKLSERDLLSLMDRFGIGTDATVSDHIAKQQVRPAVLLLLLLLLLWVAVMLAALRCVGAGGALHINRGLVQHCAKTRFGTLCSVHLVEQGPPRKNASSDGDGCHRCLG
jgi:hypothetical protein